MKRVFAAVALAVLASALFVAVGGRSTSARAATGTCVKHTKRVVKHVRHHGKRARVVHMKHYWTCEEASAPSVPAAPVPAPTLPAPTLVPAPVTETPPTAVPQPEPEANAIGVTAAENPYSFLPSRTTVRPGKLTVQLDNGGEDPHDMYMEKVGPENEPEGEVIKVSTKTEPGQQTTKSVEVEVGTYRMWCSFGNHAMEGMETHVTVAE